MADNTQLNVMSGGDLIQTEDFGPSGKIQRIKLVLGNKDVDNGDVSSTNALPVSGNFYQATQPVSIASMPSTPVTGTFWQATQPVSITSLPTLAVGNNVIGKVGIDQTTPGTTNGVQVNAALPAGANTIGNVGQNGTWTVQPGNTANTTPWLTTDTPSTSGGLTAYKLISAATTNATSVKASAGQLYTIAAFNTTASVAYLKLYNKASAPTVGTDTPVHTYVLPANSTNGAGFVLNIDKGITFSTGIAFAITGAITDADTTAVAANQVIVNLDYK